MASFVSDITLEQPHQPVYDAAVRGEIQPGDLLSLLSNNHTFVNFIVLSADYSGHMPDDPYVTNICGGILFIVRPLSKKYKDVDYVILYDHCDDTRYALERIGPSDDSLSPDWLAR